MNNQCGSRYALHPSPLVMTPLAICICSASPANRGTSFSFATHSSSPCGAGSLISMASTCCPTIADHYPYGSIFELGMQTSKPLASSDAQPRGFAACFQSGQKISPAIPETPAVVLEDVRRGGDDHSHDGNIAFIFIRPWSTETNKASCPSVIPRTEATQGEHQAKFALGENVFGRWRISWRLRH